MEAKCPFCGGWEWIISEQEISCSNCGEGIKLKKETFARDLFMFLTERRVKKDE